MENEQDFAADFESVEEEEDESIQNQLESTCYAYEDLRQQIDNMFNLLPASIKRRVKSLKKLQSETTSIEARFFKDVYDLEKKYHKIYVPFYEKRNKIVNGLYEPTDDECQWPFDDDEVELPQDIKDKLKCPVDENQKGIPEFWLTVFVNAGMLSEMIQPHDLPILKYMTDIKAIPKEKPMSFILEFHFAPNEYFTNTKLTKEYDTRYLSEEEDPFNVGSPEIKCTGCIINWKPGKNVTIKTLNTNEINNITTAAKTVRVDSFFSFFTPPIILSDIKNEDLDEEVRNLLTLDFEIGNFIRGRIVPRAVLFFTGEACEEEEEEEEEEEDEDEKEANMKNGK